MTARRHVAIPTTFSSIGHAKPDLASYDPAGRRAADNQRADDIAAQVQAIQAEARRRAGEPS